MNSSFEDEEVYNIHTDTAGNWHWIGTKTGHHILQLKNDELNSRKDRGVDIKTITIKDLEEGYIGVATDCHLCGETFAMDRYSVDTICPKCKELWKRFVADREINLSVKINKDMELKENG